MSSDGLGGQPALFKKSLGEQYNGVAQGDRSMPQQPHARNERVETRQVAFAGGGRYLIASQSIGAEKRECPLSGVQLAVLDNDGLGRLLQYHANEAPAPLG